MMILDQTGYFFFLIKSRAKPADAPELFFYLTPWFSHG